MDTTLTIQLFFFATAVPVALEAYKARGLARIVLWAVAGIFGIAGFIWPALKDGLPAIGAKLAELATDPVAWFALLIVVFFILRPFWSKPTAPLVVSQLNDGDGVDLGATIDARLNEFLATTLRAEFAKHSDIHEHDVKLGELADKVKAAQGSAQVTFDFAKKEVARLDERIGEIAQGSLDLERKWNDWTRQYTDDIERRFEWVDAGFRAILDRERLATLDQKIRDIGDVLLAPRSGKEISDWDEWDVLRGQFQSCLDTWLELADAYRVGVTDRVKYAKKDRLEGKWAEDHLLPGPDRIVTYRWLAITFDNFCHERGQVVSAVMSAAYGHPSKKSPLGYGDD